MTTRRCNKCAEIKNVSCFRLRTNGKPYSHCKSCESQYKKYYKNTPKGKEIQAACQARYANTEKAWSSLKNLFTRAKACAKQRNKEFSLDFEQYKILIEQSCYYCNNLLSTGKNRGIGLDRIDNNRGYTIDNVVRCCNFCNQIRGDNLTVDEMKQVSNLIINLRGLNTNNTI